jgi:hypothetical protein
LQVLTEEQEEEKLRKESAHLPPRNVLVCWAVRDLVCACACARVLLPSPHVLA